MERRDPSATPQSNRLAVFPEEESQGGIDDSRQRTWAPDAEGTSPLISVPVTKVHFLQAMAEDGPGARPCRIGGHPVQWVIQLTTS